MTTCVKCRLKFQAIAEKTAKNVGVYFFAAPCSSITV